MREDAVYGRGGGVGEDRRGKKKDDSERRHGREGEGLIADAPWRAPRARRESSATRSHSSLVNNDARRFPSRAVGRATRRRESVAAQAIIQSE